MATTSKQGTPSANLSVKSSPWIWVIWVLLAIVVCAALLFWATGGAPFEFSASGPGGINASAKVGPAPSKPEQTRNVGEAERAPQIGTNQNMGMSVGGQGNNSQGSINVVANNASILPSTSTVPSNLSGQVPALVQSKPGRFFCSNVISDINELQAQCGANAAPGSFEERYLDRMCGAEGNAMLLSGAQSELPRIRTCRETQLKDAVAARENCQKDLRTRIADSRDC